MGEDGECGDGSWRWEKGVFGGVQLKRLHGDAIGLPSGDLKHLSMDLSGNLTRLSPVHFVFIRES